MAQDTAFAKPVLFKKVVTADREDTSGYQELYSPAVVFDGADLIGLAADTYKLGVDVDGGGSADKDIVIAGGEDYDDLAALIDTAVAGAVCAIVNGKIRITSSSAGVESTIVITEGATDGLIAALAAALTEDVDIGTAVDGREGVVAIEVIPSESLGKKDFYFIANCFSSTGLQKAGLIYTFSKSEGKVYAADNADTTEVKDGDLITLVGVFV